MTVAATTTATDRPAIGRRAWRPIAGLLSAQIVTGIVLGVIWLKWSPRTVSYVLSNGTGGSYIIPDESEAHVAGDGRFAVLMLAAGLVFGVLAWLLRGARGPVTLVTLAVGSVLGALAARTTGQLFASGTDTGAVNTAIAPKLALHATSALFLWGLVAVVVYTLLAGLSSDPYLGGPAPEPELEPEPTALPA